MTITINIVEILRATFIFGWIVLAAFAGFAFAMNEGWDGSDWRDKVGFTAFMLLTIGSAFLLYFTK